MSDKEKRTPISIYLTPRASRILNLYSKGSGYGSVSRTVEEIILAFDFTYNTIKEALRYIKSKAPKGELTNAETVMLVSYIITVITNTDNTISRLSKAEQKEKKKE